MTDTAPRPPRPDAPLPGLARHRTATPTPIHTVRVIASDPARHATLEKARVRLLVAAGGFSLLFIAVVIKLAAATVIIPTKPKLATPTRPETPALVANAPESEGAASPALAPPPMPSGPRTRAQITDRNGELLALSLPISALYANPKEMIDAGDAARKLKQVLPRLDLEVLRARLGSDKQFVYLARNITPKEQLAINNLGIPGVYFEMGEKRRYPQGRLAAHVVGAVDVDANGTAGVERFFDKRLRDDPTPLRLSIDLRVQAALRDELSKSMAEFQAIGACGIVMDVRTGEVIAMVSLPDFDANKLNEAKTEERFNRAVTGMYEPGSTFKLQTAAMALDSGAAQLWSQFDAANDIKIGKFTISDFMGKHRVLALPEVIAFSSNLGAARMAQTVGGERQRAWLEKMGMFARIGVELPEAGRPIVQKPENWKEIATMTVGFGHGIAVSPLHVVRGTAAIANGGLVMPPTILAIEPGSPPRDSVRVMQQSTSDTMRKLMRLVVTDGYGKPAEVPGYYVGGKTGTAEKTAGRGYNKKVNISAFMSVFPMNAPRYAVYFMLDAPKGNASTGGYSTAGAVSAPGAGRVIARIGPMLGLMPDTANAPAINASLAIPLQPGRPPNWRPPAPATARSEDGGAHGHRNTTPRPAAPPAPAPPTPTAPAASPSANVPSANTPPRHHEADGSRPRLADAR